MVFTEKLHMNNGTSNNRLIIGVLFC